EQVYRVRLGQAGELAVAQRVDAKEIVVVGGPDEMCEPGKDVGRPISRRSERGEALAEEALVDRRRDAHFVPLSRCGTAAIGRPCGAPHAVARCSQRCRQQIPRPVCALPVGGASAAYGAATARRRLSATGGW